MSNFSVYTMNNGKAVAYQMDDARIVESKKGKESQVKVGGVWIKYDGEYSPCFINRVLGALDDK